MAVHSSDPPDPLPAAGTADAFPEAPSAPSVPADAHEALQAAWRTWQAALARLVEEEERHWAVLSAEAWPDPDVVTVLDALHAEERRAYAAYRALLTVPGQDRAG